MIKVQKIYKYSLLAILSLGTYAVFGQTPNWQNMDLKQDGTFGISTERAYQELLKDKKPQPVIVAVIDAGVDTLHEDLKSVLWRNAKPKKFDNGTYGWSYIGSAKGNVRFDNLELTRQVRQLSAEFSGKDTVALKKSDLAAFHTFQDEKKQLDKQLAKVRDNLQYMNTFKNILNNVCRKIGKISPGLADFTAYHPDGKNETYVVGVVVKALKEKDDFADFKKTQIDDYIAHYKDQEDYFLNVNYDPRSIVGDDYFKSKQRKYGSGDVMGPDAEHGTHVSGIIAAVRNNGIGMNGICNDVQIMAIRAVPEGDERDKDVANAIRYAVDHGAKVINMSFGKDLSQDKKAVDEAVKYAVKKDVLLVQAAGNDNKDIDTLPHFPNPDYLNGGIAGSYLVVGASGMKNDSTLKAAFSNYGKTQVDVFAPGVQIYSCIPRSKYAYFDGTSMACPMVAGLAALIREYYPKLTAVQVKEIIMQSVVKSPYLEKYCATAGVVNAYQAILLAEKYTAI